MLLADVNAHQGSPLADSAKVPMHDTPNGSNFVIKRMLFPHPRPGVVDIIFMAGAHVRGPNFAKGPRFRRGVPR